jgi:desulfoferrodoxin-like iron-binding protein
MVLGCIEVRLRVFNEIIGCRVAPKAERN